jgi:hypothetical protein
MFTTYQLVQDFATTHSRKIVENECQMDRQVGKVTETMRLDHQHPGNTFYLCWNTLSNVQFSKHGIWLPVIPPSPGCDFKG